MSNTPELYHEQWQTIDQATDLEPVALIQQAISQLPEDAGAVLEPPLIKAFKALYYNNPADYARFRLQVKESKQVTMTLFDKLTMPSSTHQSPPMLLELFPAVTLWEHTVQGEQLFNEIRDTIKQYVIADDETIMAATLWVGYTWFIDIVSYAPIANITAPEKRCGKTKLLSILKRLSYQAFTTSNISAAALFRLIELYNPTLLIDEVDSFLNLHEDMRGIINAGFTRESAFIVRCVGDNLEPTPFSVWGAKALCGIGKIADTLQDRSITLKLRRKTLNETVQNIDRSEPNQWVTFRAKLARFAQDNKATLIHNQPEPLPQLNDRANDCWEPLRQIAHLAGGHWPQTAIQAALLINGEQTEDDSTRTELLRDIKTLFDTKQLDRIFSHELINELNADNEANWCIWNKGRGITARNLAKILKEFDIVSNTIRIGIDQRAKGYTKDQFKDAFTRYLTQPTVSTPAISVTTGQLKAPKESSQNAIRDIPPMSRQKNTPQANDHSSCHVVTDTKPQTTTKYHQTEPLNNQNPMQSAITLNNTSVTTGQVKAHHEFSPKNKRDIEPVSRIEKTPHSNSNNDCHVVTDKTPPEAEGYSTKQQKNNKHGHSINDLMDDEEKLKEPKYEIKDDAIYFDLD